jgi:hypothetical protein
MYQNQEMTMHNAKLVIVLSLFSEVSLRDQEQMNAINARKMVQLLNGVKLQRQPKKNHAKEHLILLHTIKDNAIFLEVKMMIITSYAIYGSLILNVTVILGLI